MPDRQDLRLHHYWRGFGRLRIGQPADRGHGQKTLLLEAGGWDRDPWIKIPLGWPRLLLNRKHDWMYFAEPEASTGGRGLECARGRVIGGSSSINAMAYTRGHRGDYDRWAASGLTEWSYAHVLPYFRRQESWEGGASFFRGGGGPLSTQMTRFSDPLVDAFAAAGQAAGYKTTPDHNGAQQEGFGVWQMTVRDGHRCSAADAYLRPALDRMNLKVETGRAGHANRIQRQARHRRRIHPARQGRYRIRGPRNHPLRRRHQLAAASDAVGRSAIRTNCALKASP